jgi:nitrous oxidase accessory protein NosD
MRFQISVALLLLAAPVLSTPTPDQGSDCTKTVKSGQSIQKAIDDAKSGDKIIVEAGEYHEQLTITKDGIHLIGKGAVLLPPNEGYKPNFCTGLSRTFEPDNKDAEAGICIYGQGFELAPYNRALQHRKVNKTGNYITNVVVSGFEIRNFTGENIALIGGHDVKIRNNKLVDGAQYGFLTVGSKSTEAENNIVTSSGLAFIAMCMDDDSGARFERNDISNYYIGLCTQTPGGVVKKNTVTNCCYGPFVDPGIDGAKIIENTISTRNPGCLPRTGAGIAVLGAVNTVVERNTVEHFQFNKTGLGILVSDDPVTGALAKGNVFRKNVLRFNDLDIHNFANATDNVFRGNECETSLPMELCGV